MSSTASQEQKHVKGSKTKYQAGTIVVTERGRRAQVQADGRWKWLAKTSNTVASVRPSDEPKPKKQKKERVIQELPKKKPVLKRQNATINPAPVATPKTKKAKEAVREINAFSNTDEASVKTSNRPKKKRKTTDAAGKGWLSWL